jgi:dipeptidyl aminopeptidase/acylaminoacyl peptidase
VLALVVVGMVVSVVHRHSPRGGAPTASASAGGPALPAFTPTHARRITFGEVCDEDPAFTPDGESVVFDRTVAGASNIMVMNLRDAGTQPVTQMTGWNYAARVSPDGSTIAFLHESGRETGTYLAPTDGSRPPHLFSAGSAEPDWSTDGRSIWAGEDTRLVRYDLASGTPLEQIDEPAEYGSGGARVAAGGRLLILAGRGYTEAVASALVSHEPGGARRKLFDGPLNHSLTLWPDRDHALVGKVHADTGAIDLVVVPLDGSAAQLLSGTGVTPSEGLDISPDRRRIVWSTCSAPWSLVWLDGKAAGTPFHPEESDSLIDAAPVHGTSSIVVLSTRGGPRQAWILDTRGQARPRPLGLDEESLGDDTAVSSFSRDCPPRASCPRSSTRGPARSARCRRACLPRTTFRSPSPRTAVV